METKVCKICNQEKEITEFKLKKNKGKEYRLNFCKVCEKIKNNDYQKNYNKKNKEKIKEYKKTRYLLNKNIIDEKNKEYAKNNKEKLMLYRIKNKEINNLRSKKYRDENKEKVKEYNKNYYKKNKQQLLEKEKEYKRKKRNEDDLYKFKERIRNLIKSSFVRKNIHKRNKTEEILGCTIENFINHLLYTFEKNYGYKWDKKEEVHIDHIIPLKEAKTEYDVIRLCNYINLQLLKKEDNLKKSSKLNYEMEEFKC